MGLYNRDRNGWYGNDNKANRFTDPATGEAYFPLVNEKTGEVLFECDEENIFCQIPISITTAILVGEVEVPTIDGKKARLNIPSGTQSETQFRLKGKGMSVLRQTRRGDMYVETTVEIPVNLNNKQKAILQEFEKEGGTSKKHSPKSQSFFSKLKQVWEDLP